MSDSNFTKNAVVLGLLTAVGPFAIDMYLPALPTIAADLKTSTATTQMTLTVFFMAFGICQILYGPISDMAGRKPPLYVGLGLFILGSIGCAFAPGIGWLIACRALQGAGASGLMVIPRAVVRDLHTGPDAARLMALVMLVFSVCPILAPLLGSSLIVPFGWRAVFVAVTIIASCAFVMTATLLPETRLRHSRVETSVRSVIDGFGKLLRDMQFLGLTFIGGIGMASFFTFLASSSFVYIGHYGLTPTLFSLAFSLNAIGFIGSSQFAGRLGKQFGMGRVVISATAAYAFFTTVLLGLNLAGVDSLAVLMTLFFLGFAAMGLVIPSTMVLALEKHGPIAGMASALAGTLQMLCGGLTIIIVGLFFDGTPRPMVAAIALCAIGAFALSVVTLGQRKPVWQVRSSL
jgi:MFS transporter, DHA1 family, multidrug resistance protein